MSLQIRPCTVKDASRFIREHHRHHRPPAGGLFAVAVESDGERVVVAVVGRPVARLSDDGETAEVIRVATDVDPRRQLKLSVLRALRKLPKEDLNDIREALDSLLVGGVPEPDEKRGAA